MKFFSLVPFMESGLQCVHNYSAMLRSNYWRPAFCDEIESSALRV